MRILFNIFVDRWRRRSREVELKSAVLERLVAPERYEPRPWEALSVDDVGAALCELELPFREVLRLYACGDQSYRDIGRCLGVPYATVGTRLLRARRKMRNLLEQRLADLDVAFGVTMEARGPRAAVARSH